jgi:hypothetical protein
MQWAAVAAGALALAGRGAALVHSYSTAPAAEYINSPDPLPTNFTAEAAAYGLMVVMQPGVGLFTALAQVMAIMLSCAPLHIAAILMVSLPAMVLMSCLQAQSCCASPAFSSTACVPNSHLLNSHLLGHADVSVYVRVYILQSPTKLYLTADISQEVVNYVGIVTFLMCAWNYLHSSDKDPQPAGARGRWAEQSIAGQQQQQQDQLANGQGMLPGGNSSAAATKAQPLLLHVMQPHCAYFLATHVLALMFIVAFLLDQ